MPSRSTGKAKPPLPIPPGQLEIKYGDPRLLVIAPHGFPSKKDENEGEHGTAAIVRQIRGLRGCSVIINDKIRKSTKNLNRIDQVEDYPEYTDAIREAVKGDDHTLVVFIHGAADTSIKAEAEDLEYKGDLAAVIGYGQPKNPCAGEKTAEKLIKALTDNGLPSAAATEQVPSESSFYRAVGLVAQRAIAEQKGLSALTILGHTHSVRLLNYPKLKEVKGDDFDAAIEPAFQVREELAQVAVDDGLSTRQFEKVIKNHQNKLNPKDLPPKKDLLKRDPEELIQLYDETLAKIDSSQKAAFQYGKTMNRLKSAITELTGEVQGDGGFQDWTKSKNNVNICTGCLNDCRYCYMKPINIRNKAFKQPADWGNWVLRQKDVQATRGLRDGLVGFPSSHDIFPEILDAYLEVLGKILRAGNEVLIVSKPRLECIRAICSASAFFKDKILFRFTIGANDNDILRFWEPNAPTYEERKDCLAHALGQGFRTSVSVEPMLDSPRIEQLVKDLDPLVNDSIWVGMMSHLSHLKNWSKVKGFEGRKSQIEAGQTPEMLTAIYDAFADNPKVQWKTETLKVIMEHKKQAGQIKGTMQVAAGKLVPVGEAPLAQ